MITTNALPACPAGAGLLPGEVAAPRVALLEDDELLRDRILVPRLRQYGFEVLPMGRAAELHAQLPLALFDILVLDVGLPDQDGFSVARQVHEVAPALGIVMLTGRQDSADRVRGLSEGADAYLSKPVEIDVLAATLHSLARRLSASAAERPGRWRLEAGGWCLRTPSGASVALTGSERRVLAKLIVASRAVVAREELIAALTENVYDFDPHRLDSLIYRLRRKVSDTTGEILPLNAVHGEGYVFST